MELNSFQAEVALRIGVAALAGGAVGIERELRDRTAGLRTHRLVAVGACLFALVSAFGFDDLVAGTADASTIRHDPSRVASNIVTGVGFLGAGAILRSGLSVQGLTTAASLWVVAALGTAVALGMYFATGVTLGITLLSLVVLRVLRGRIRQAAGIDEREG